MVTINGKACEVAGESLAAYLAQNGYVSARVAVECNGNIIPKAAYAETWLQDGDQIEIVSFVGGG